MLKHLTEIRETFFKLDYLVIIRGFNYWKAIKKSCTKYNSGYTYKKGTCES